jgi:hypothetical protein
VLLPAAGMEAGRSVLWRGEITTGWYSFVTLVWYGCTEVRESNLPATGPNIVILQNISYIVSLDLLRRSLAPSSNMSHTTRFSEVETPRMNTGSHTRKRTQNQTYTQYHTITHTHCHTNSCTCTHRCIYTYTKTHTDRYTHVNVGTMLVWCASPPLLKCFRELLDSRISSTHNSDTAGLYFPE